MFESERFRWIVERVLARLPATDARWGFSATDAAEFLEKHVDFVLLHEFRDGDFFDWHVDAHPDDGTGRTLNVNVVLSDPGAFGGGALQVGGANASLGRGDLHAYVRRAGASFDESRRRRGLPRG